jgi:hypothetical protein
MDVSHRQDKYQGRTKASSANHVRELGFDTEDKGAVLVLRFLGQGGSLALTFTFLKSKDLHFWIGLVIIA